MSASTCRGCAESDIRLADHRLRTEPRAEWRREIRYLVADLRSVNCRRPRIDGAARALAAKHDLPLPEVDQLLLELHDEWTRRRRLVMAVRVDAEGQGRIACRDPESGPWSTKP